MRIRRERPQDVTRIRAVHAAAFVGGAPPGEVPVEVGLLDALRASDDWLPRLSLVAIATPDGDSDDVVVGHVCCTRARIAGTIPALGLGPLGVAPAHQRRGVGSALVHAVVAAAEALDARVVVLLGSTEYYPRLGFVPARTFGIVAPDPTWGDHFQARPLGAAARNLRLAGTFAYAAPFQDL